MEWCNQPFAHLNAHLKSFQAEDRILSAEHGANVDAKRAGGATALMEAAQHGHLEIVRYLSAKRGANVHAVDACGATALMRAAYI